MTAITIAALLLVGGFCGAVLMAIVAGRKRPVPKPITLEEVLYWIANCYTDPEKAAYLVVRKVYSGKRHIHRNGARKLPLEKVMEGEG
jgi:hypothetical protein